MEPTIPLFSYIATPVLKHKGMIPEKDIPLCSIHVTGI